MLRKFFFTVCIFLITAIATIVTANLDSFNSGISQMPRIITYVLKAFVFYSVFVIIQGKFKFSITYSFIIFAFSVLAIDCTVFIDGQKLIPLRFPFETLFSFLGLIGAVVFLRRKRIFYYYLTGFIIFSVLSHVCFIPVIIRFMEKRLTSSVAHSSPFGKGEIYTIANQAITFQDTAKKKCALIEYYFVGCPPCEKKIKYLKKLKEKVNSSQFNIFLVCDGSISSFDSFFSNAQRNNYQGFSFFYDKNQLKSKIMPGSNYPHEIIIDSEGKIISSQIGFNEETAEAYLSDNYKAILSVLGK
jgi:Redoxin